MDGAGNNRIGNQSHLYVAARVVAALVMHHRGRGIFGRSIHRYPFGDDWRVRANRCNRNSIYW